MIFKIESDGLPSEEAEVAFRGDEREGPEEKLRWRTLKGLRPSFTFEGRPLSPGNSANYKQEVDPKTGNISTSWTQPGVGKVFVRVQGLGLHYEIEAGVSPERQGTLKGVSETFVETGVEPVGNCDLYLGFGKDRTKEVSTLCRVNEVSSITLSARYTHKLTQPTRPKMPEIVVDGPREDQEIIDKLVFQVVGYSRHAGPFGGTNNRYYGHTFWDADVWVFPALALLDPEAAKRIPDYRISTSEGAAKNYQRWIAQDRPIAGGKKLGPAKPVDGGMKFAWESGATGVETAPGDSRYQDHVSGSVVLGLRNASALGLVTDGWAARRVEAGVYTFYSQRVESRKGDSSTWALPGVMSPDEYHIGDNDLYTNLVAQVPRRWSSVPSQETAWMWAKQLVIPKDSQGRLLNYEADQEKAYQQAAGLLAVFPLQDPEAEEQAIAMLERFAPKVIKNGPAMSDSLHALIRARFGDADQAYEEWRGAHERYAKPPFGFISERPTTDQTVFVTGASGFLNTVLYGFVGIRVHEEPWGDAEWSLPLEGGWTISGRANLPSDWKSVTIPDLRILGGSYTLRATQMGSTLSKN